MTVAAGLGSLPFKLFKLLIMIMNLKLVCVTEFKFRRVERVNSESVRVTVNVAVPAGGDCCQPSLTCN